MALTRLLKKDTKGDDVKEIQNVLITLGYGVGVAGADGDFGYHTESAVKDFQNKNNLQANGTVDQITYDIMIQMLQATGKVAPPSVTNQTTETTQQLSLLSEFNWKTVGFIASIALGLFLYFKASKDSDYDND